MLRVVMPVMGPTIEPDVEEWRGAALCYAGGQLHAPLVPDGMMMARVRSLMCCSSLPASTWWVSAALWELLGRPPLSWADAVHVLFFPLVLSGVLAYPAEPLDEGHHQHGEHAEPGA